MGTPARLGPVCVSHDDAAVEDLNHRGAAQDSQSVFYSVAEKDLHSQTGASW